MAARPPLGCSICVGAEEDGRFWMRDQNGARWLCYPQPSGGNWTGYTDQYSSIQSQIFVAISQPRLIELIYGLAESHKAHLLDKPTYPDDPAYVGVNYSVTPITKAGCTSGGCTDIEVTTISPVHITGDAPDAPTVKKEGNGMLYAGIGLGVAALLLLKK